MAFAFACTGLSHDLIAQQSVMSSLAASVDPAPLISVRSNDLPEAPNPARYVEPLLIGPVPSRSGFAPKDATTGNALRVAPMYHRYIEPFETAQRLTKTEKVIFGFRQSISPYFVLTVFAAAGYEQAANSGPNYGSNIRAYGQRVGAAVIRDTSQSVFSDSLMATILRQDPRYYIMGKRRNALVRTGYAVSRVVVTRSSDDGHPMPNYSQVAGYAEAAALTNAYYPEVNVGLGQTGRSLEGSLLGVAVSNVVREFYPDLLHALHLGRFE